MQKICVGHVHREENDLFLPKLLTQSITELSFELESEKTWMDEARNDWREIGIVLKKMYLVVLIHTSEYINLILCDPIYLLIVFPGFQEVNSVRQCPV